jgi:hypothetical protein
MATQQSMRDERGHLARVSWGSLSMRVQVTCASGEFVGHWMAVVLAGGGRCMRCVLHGSRMRSPWEPWLAVSGPTEDG